MFVRRLFSKTAPFLHNFAKTSVQEWESGECFTEIRTQFAFRG